MRQRTWVRAGLVVGGGLLLAGGVAVLAVVPPSAGSLYPKCQLYQTTGLHCMGCGMTRSAHAMLNGQLAQAVAYNLFTPLLVLWLGYEGWRWAAARVRGRPYPGWWFRAAWTPWLLGVLGLYMLLRNLPLWPFSLLAPHDLAG